MIAKTVNAFVKSTKALFDSTLHTPMLISQPRLRVVGERSHKFFQITTLVRLSGSVQGCVWISYSEEVAIAMASALAQEKFTTLSADCRDALAEIGNMIVGSAKNDLAAGGVNISIPELLPTEKIEYQPRIPTISIPIDTASGRFVIEIQLTPANSTVKSVAA
jgi:CheY-specific phosphatase CheX